MNYLIEPLANDAYALAIKDHTTWDVVSYTNIYILKRQSQVILIDCGLSLYHKALFEALAKLAVLPEQVTHLLLTHGHRDHVECANRFIHAKKYIHRDDLPLLSPELRREFTTYIPNNCEYQLIAPGLDNFNITHVNTHSPGSVAIFDQESKSLFVGDFFCYFGEELPEGKLVAYSDYVRNGSCEYVAGQVKNGGTEFKQFCDGLSRIMDYEAEFFCTGHGFVLHADIRSFLNKMWQSGTRSQP